MAREGRPRPRGCNPPKVRGGIILTFTWDKKAFASNVKDTNGLYYPHHSFPPSPHPLAFTFFREVYRLSSVGRENGCGSRGRCLASSRWQVKLSSCYSLGTCPVYSKPLHSVKSWLKHVEKRCHQKQMQRVCSFI